MKGTIFDIRRFSTHDGDGIRTTIFLKGCPLSCVWCHNPEGISTRARPLYFQNKCIHCGICASLSSNGGVVMADGSPVLDITRAELWQEIINACPAGALAWDSREMTVDEVVATVMRDQPFYKYGGGVTLSGGEPLLQAEFAVALLKALKNQGIHTAIETALHVPVGVLKRALPFLDLIYADLKIFDEKEHIRFTGKTSQVIKENIKFLLESEKRAAVIIRTPLIPDISANQENVAAISRFISELYPEAAYELLNYNPLAESKYRLIDQVYYFKQNPGKFTRQEMQAFANTAAAHGVKNIIIES